MGGIVAYLMPDGKVQNCEFRGSVCKRNGEAGYSVLAGGIVGKCRGTVFNCTNYGTIYGSDLNAKSDDEGFSGVCAYTGGIVGQLYGGEIISCTHAGEVIEGDSTSSADVQWGGLYTGWLAGKAAQPYQEPASKICTECNKNTSESDAELPIIGNDDGTTSQVTCSEHNN